MAIHTLTQRYRSILAAVGNALTAEELANLSTRVLKAMRSKGYCATRSAKKATLASLVIASSIVRTAGGTMAYIAPNRKLWTAKEET